MYSSDLDIDMEKEYVFQNYEFIQKKNSPVYGVESASDVRIKPVYFDELAYLLNTSGTHLILFGGPWCLKTQSIIDRINYFALQYGVDAVYNFDFRVDSESPDTSFKADITQQESYDGPGKKKSVSAANCNYIYGEMVSRYLTNAADFAGEGAGVITYLNRFDDLVTVPNLREPFLFLYNKDNTIDYSGRHTKEGTYPIICGMYLECYRGSQGELYRDEKRNDSSMRIDDMDELLQDGIFRYIGRDGNDITPYTHADYLFDAFKQNARGHSFKTEDCFKKGEQINICPITFAQLYWMLEQEGSFVIFFCGAWCANSQAGIATVNDYAVANHIRVYMIDVRADGKFPIDFWGYPRKNELRINMPSMAPKYFRLWEERLSGARLLCSIPPQRPVHPVNLLQTYQDPEGIEHGIYPVDIPYFLAVNKDHLDRRGNKRPVLESCNHGGIELLNCEKTFVYYKPNYQRYSSGVFSVIQAYCESMGKEAKEKLIDRTASLVEGSAVENPSFKMIVDYHKEHDWFKEMNEDGTPKETTFVNSGHEESDECNV